MVMYMDRSRKKLMTMVTILGGLWLTMKALSEKRTEKKDIDNENTYLEKKAYVPGTPTAYELSIKPVIDRILSFLGLVLLLPVFGIISLAIFIDDPGPVFFTQTRIGKDKHFFCLHKFRSMRMDTPHDIPTHQLENPEQYITRVGKFLRKSSLDELPQIWDIFRGKMSIIGPRPALWNQEDLVEQREIYGANSVTPGLTGWAQINGRDELEIPDKAKLDGEYIAHLRQGGIKALVFDVKCFLGTVRSVVNSEGVLEGGTRGKYKARTGETDAENVPGNEKYSQIMSEIGHVNLEDCGFDDYGYLKSFDIDTSPINHKRVLITGENSYIGEYFKAYANRNYGENFLIDTVDMIDGSWRKKDFSGYDAVFHVAGIAHADVGNVSEETKASYYSVNTDLAIETCQKAKTDGVKQFVFMSSMIVYGESAGYGKNKCIDEHSIPAPANFYGDSKWQADVGVRKMSNADFCVAVLRPPMIYGKGSKGNYKTLAKLAKTMPVFPDIDNSRSMLHIDNLCEFLCKLILSGEGGVYFPQNEEYTKTSSMAEEIAAAVHKKIFVTHLLNPAVAIGGCIPGKISSLVNKAFGNMVYSQVLSEYPGLEYRVNTFHDSIVLTEENES